MQLALIVEEPRRFVVEEGIRVPGVPQRHCQVNEKSLSDTFPLRKAEGLRIAKILEFVKAQNLPWFSIHCTNVQFLALT
jgi:hypothetical protein